MERTRAGLGHLVTRADTRAGRRRSLVAGSVCLVSLLALLANVECANVDRGLGQACIRSEDCLSGACAGQVCVAQPAVFDAAALPDSSGDGAVTPDGAPSDAASDATPPPPPHDATLPPVDAAPDAHDAMDAAPLTDASGAHDARDAMSAPHDAASAGDATDAPSKAADAASEGSTDAHMADAHPAG